MFWIPRSMQFSVQIIKQLQVLITVVGRLWTTLLVGKLRELFEVASNRSTPERSYSSGYMSAPESDGALKESYGSEQSVFALPFEELVERFVDNELISWDPHFHSLFSDGEWVRDMYNTLEKMGKKGSVADHSRDSTEPVLLYDSNNNEAYIITSEKEISQQEYINYLRNTIDEQQPENSMNVTRGEIIRVYSHISENSSEQELESEVDEFLHQEEVAVVSPKIPEKYRGRVTASIERDYESWIENGIERFLQQNDLSHAVISVHNLPEEFIEDNIHDKQTQYIRKADLSHLDSKSLEEAVDRYQAEYMRAILETNEFSNLTYDEREEMEHLYNEYSERHNFDEYFSNNISAGTEVIHSHWDLVLTNPCLREHVREDHMDDIIDFASMADATMEVNGRVIAKLRPEFAQEDNFYEPGDAEIFGKKLALKAAKGEIDYVASTDAHTPWEMYKQHLLLEPIVKYARSKSEETESGSALMRDYAPQDKVQFLSSD